MDNHNVSHENQDAASFQPTNWDMCALCQNNTKEKLQCPTNARQTNQGSTYVTLAENLTKFGECGALSPGFLTRLDDGDGVEETLQQDSDSHCRRRCGGSFCGCHDSPPSPGIMDCHGYRKRLPIHCSS